MTRCFMCARGLAVREPGPQGGLGRNLLLARGARRRYARAKRARGRDSGRGAPWSLREPWRILRRPFPALDAYPARPTLVLRAAPRDAALSSDASMQITEIRVDGYEKVVRCKDQDSGLHAIVAVHDTTLGPSLGGLRMLPYANEEEALFDVLRLARGMT